MLSAKYNIFMNTLDCLIGKELQAATDREYDWVFTFQDGINLTVECLWRLIEGKRIKLTSEDNGQQFGLPAPIVAIDELRKILIGAEIRSIELCEGTLDLVLKFGSGLSLEIIPTSSGHEAWNIGVNDKLYIAGGGGELSVFDAGKAGG